MVDALRELSEVGVRLYRANAAYYPLVFLHTITVPEALRSLLPYLPPGGQTLAYAFTWQYVAAVVACFGSAEPGTPVELDQPSSVADVIDRCVETGDEHAFKLTAACVREYQRHQDPVFLAVADDWNTKMLNARSWDFTRRKAAGMAF